MLRDMGLDPSSDDARNAVTLVRNNATWHSRGPWHGTPLFAGEVEPCINGRVVTVGSYFGRGRAADLYNNSVGVGIGRSIIRAGWTWWPGRVELLAELKCKAALDNGALRLNAGGRLLRSDGTPLRQSGQ